MCKCKGCGIEFVPKRKGQRYHNRACYLISTTKLVICPQCKILFKKKFTKQVCCSSKCANAYRAKNQTKGVTIPCNFCGKPVYKMQSRRRKYNFCNDVCRISYLKSPQNTSMSKGWNQTEEAIEKIRKANLDRDYDKCFTKETRRKFAENARKYLQTREAQRKSALARKGLKLSEEHKQKIREHGKYGWKNKSWKGRYAGYQAKHIWAREYPGGPEVCADSIKEGHLCKGRIEASNINHKYRKRKGEWARRCTYHHRKYDKEYGLVEPKGRQKRFFAKFGNIQKRDFSIDGMVVEKYQHK